MRYYKAIVSLWMDTHIIEALDIIADRKGHSRSRVIRDVLTRYVEIDQDIESEKQRKIDFIFSRMEGLH